MPSRAAVVQGEWGEDPRARAIPCHRRPRVCPCVGDLSKDARMGDGTPHVTTHGISLGAYPPNIVYFSIGAARR